MVRGKLYLSWPRRRELEERGERRGAKGTNYGRKDFNTSLITHSKAWGEGAQAVTQLNSKTWGHLALGLITGTDDNPGGNYLGPIIDLGPIDINSNSFRH